MGNNQAQAAKEANEKINSLFNLKDERESVENLKAMIDEGKFNESVLAVLPIENAACKDEQRIDTSMALVCSVFFM
jgi:hypothetical protein